MTICLTLPDSSTVNLLPAKPHDGDLKKLRGLLVQMLAHWIKAEFSVGDALTEGWDLAEQIIDLLPIADAPKSRFGALEELDYQQLERLFFIDDESPELIHQWGLGEFQSQYYKGNLLTQAHLFNPRKLLGEAVDLFLEWGKVDSVIDEVLSNEPTTEIEQPTSSDRGGVGDSPVSSGDIHLEQVAA